MDEGKVRPIRWARLAMQEWDSGEISMRAEGCLSRVE